jgi:hypothetical protein
MTDPIVRETGQPKLGPKASPRRGDTTKSNVIHLHIGRLSLEGVGVALAQRRIFAASLQHELSRLIAEQPLSERLSSGGATPRLPGETLRITACPDPADLGRRIAGSLYEGLLR